MGIAFLDEHGGEINATNRFRLGDFGRRAMRGATLHSELGNCYIQPRAQPGRELRSAPLATIRKSFYAERRVLGPGHHVQRVAPVVEQSSIEEAASYGDVDGRVDPLGGRHSCWRWDAAATTP